MDWSTVLNQVVQILLPILATFFTGVCTYLAAKIKTVYEQKSQNATTKQVIDDTVRFVEQVYSDLKGPEKLEKAVEQASTVLNSKGITITEAEINMLIESAVYGLNEGWFSSDTTDTAEISDTTETDTETKTEDAE